MSAVIRKKTIDRNDPLHFFNRELSLIEFNKRVLKEAQDEKHPLLERLKFISIFSSNMDEFFMIRVAGLKRQVSAGIVELSFNGMTPEEQLYEIRKRLIPLYQMQEDILLNDILPKLEKENVFICDYESLTLKDKKYLQKYFNDCVLPILTPLSIDSGHPFPRLINRILNIVYLLLDDSEEGKKEKVAFLQLPSALSRLVLLKKETGYYFVLLEQIVIAHSKILFPGLKIISSNAFRVTRDADFEIAEDEAEDLLTEIAENIKISRWGRAVVRLEVCHNIEKKMSNLLMKSLEIDSDDIYYHKRPLNMSDFMEFLKLDKRNLKDKPYQTRILPELRSETANIFDVIKNNDLLVHHPFDSFTNSILKLLNESAIDPKVVAIKITLYRVGTNSPIVAALKQAAENGKDVTAFVELKARFDEESNINWARELENVGVHVVYGIIGLKTHCKIAIIIRKEKNILKTYLHLSTGNYNHATSRLYTDIGYFTCNPGFAKEGIHLFNFLTGYSHHKSWKNFFVAPINLRRSIIELINREKELHTDENPGLIIAKMNSLAHSDVIKALYRASSRGVRIKLLVRGICCLRPGVEGLSENIEVRSILGRFLEHSRAFYFQNAGKEEVYLSSADWMTRNLHKRVELMFPIISEPLKKQTIDLLNLYWKDNSKSWKLLSDGNYELIKPKKNEKSFCTQDYFLIEIKKKIKKLKNSHKFLII